MGGKKEYLKGEKGTVNKYAKVLGLSREGMRFLENKGIIYPERDDESGYKIYGQGDSNAIVMYKKHRRFGFDISQIKELMREQTQEGYQNMLTVRAQELQSEIEEKNKALMQMHRRIERLALEARLTGQYEVITRPAMFWMATRRNDILIESESAVSTMENWNRSFSAFADPAIVWTHERLCGREGDFYPGQVAEVEDAISENLGDVHFSSAARCLSTVCQVKYGRDMSATLFDDMIAYMNEKGIRPAGDGIARQIRMYIDEDGHYNFIWQLMVPIL